MRTRLTGAALITIVAAACADPEPATQDTDAVLEEAIDATEEVIEELDMPPDDDPEAIVEAYVDGLERLRDIAADIDDRDEAIERAVAFEYAAMHLSEVAALIERRRSAVQAELLDEQDDIVEAAGNLRREIDRLEADPEIAGAMERALNAYEEPAFFESPGAGASESARSPAERSEVPERTPVSATVSASTSNKRPSSR